MVGGALVTFLREGRAWRLTSVIALAACVEYEVEQPRPPAFPADPDGECPEYFRLDGGPWEHRMVGSDAEATVLTIAGGGESEFDGQPTLTVGMTYSTSLYQSEKHHYVCDADNVWWVADLPALDPDACGCGVADCAAMGVSWEPPRLMWWDEGIDLGIAWSESIEVTEFYVTWFDCVEDTRVVERSDIEVESVPGNIEPVDVPAGTFDARVLSVHYGHAAWYTGYWSAAMGDMVEEDHGDGDLVWKLTAWE